MGPGREVGAANRGRAVLVLWVGAVAGLVLAAHGLIASDARQGDALSERVAARVNGSEILTDDYLRLVAGLERDTRETADEKSRRHVLDRMIDEEVLVQRGLELGLAESDRRIRANVTAAMIRSILVEIEDQEPAASELREFYQDHRDFFTRPGRMRVHQLFFRVPSSSEQQAAAERARQVRDRIEPGQALAELRDDHGDPEVSPLPDALLPATKLREYLGPTALRAAFELEVGEVSQPVRSGTGYHLLQLVESEPPRTPDLSEIEDQVRTEWLRRAGDRALREYLDALRDQAEIVVAPRLP
jgi:parvulin-like peptidyl-prolyl isomerase